MTPLDTSLFSLSITLLGVLGGTALCLLLLWMFRQQRFLNELFHAIRKLERGNREAQRDLLFPLGGRIGEVPVLRFTPGALEQERARSKKDYGMTLDEAKLLVALSKSAGDKPASTSAIHLGLLRN